MLRSSKVRRQNELFLRAAFKEKGGFEFPLIRKQEISLEDVRLMSCAVTRRSEDVLHARVGIHFFVEDYRFEHIYDHPERTFAKYAQYAFLLSPDYSLYPEMPLWRQIESIARNRWVGAYWQSRGLKVIPSITWGDERSFAFCFAGVEKGAIVAVGMVGCRRNRRAFMQGYEEMLRQIEPQAILVYGRPFPEMKGRIVSVPYSIHRKEALQYGR